MAKACQIVLSVELCPVTVGDFNCNSNHSPPSVSHEACLAGLTTVGARQPFGLAVTIRFVVRDTRRGMAQNGNMRAYWTSQACGQEFAARSPGRLICCGFDSEKF